MRIDVSSIVDDWLGRIAQQQSTLSGANVSVNREATHEFPDPVTSLQWLIIHSVGAAAGRLILNSALRQL